MAGDFKEKVLCRRAMTVLLRVLAILLFLMAFAAGAIITKGILLIAVAGIIGLTLLVMFIYNFIWGLDGAE